jgi:hypothetical protein
MQWTSFDRHWPCIGLALSVLLLLLLFATNVLRNDLGISRWRDPVWLSWLAPAAYMIHQFEEYGIDARGLDLPSPASSVSPWGCRPIRNVLSHQRSLSL